MKLILIAAGLLLCCPLSNSAQAEAFPPLPYIPSCELAQRDALYAQAFLHSPKLRDQADAEVLRHCGEEAL
jgi:hypothetical protein